jgi:hypothetical protein
MAGSRAPSCIGAALAVWLATLPASGSDALSLNGVARDSVGNLLSDVRVLILPEPIGSPPVRETRTTAGGHFTFADLAPGIYRIAAVKEGYLAFLGTVNTTVRPSLNIVLQSLPQPDDPTAEPDSAWALRLPRRSILRDVEPLSTPGPEVPVPAATAPEASETGLRGTFEQLLALTAGSGSADAKDGIRGGETRFGLTLPAPRDVTMTVSGYRERSTPEPARAGEVGRLEEAGARWGLSHGFGPESTVDVRAYYDRARSSPSSAGPDGTAGDQRVWGYDATWSKELHDRSRVRLGVDYQEAALGSSGAILGGRSDPPPAEFSNRMMGAQTSFENPPGERHRYRVAVRALRATLPEPRLRASQPMPPMETTVQDGWNVGLVAEDQWAVSGGWSVIYGLTYHENLNIPRASRVMPRLGAEWSGEDVEARVVLSYPTSAQGSGDPLGMPDSLAPDRALGYDVAIEGALPGGVRVRVHRRYEPVPSGLTEASSAAAPRPLYLAGDSVATLENAFAVERDLGAARLIVEAVHGVAEGSVARIPAFDLPVLVLADRELAFDAASLGVRLAPTRTEIVTEYQRVLDAPPPGAAEQQRSVHDLFEVRLAQALGRRETGSMSWTLLLAGRSARVSQQDGPDLVFDGLVRQFSAGVSVEF